MPVYKNRDYINLLYPLPEFIERDIHNIPFIEPTPIDISQINNGLWTMTSASFFMKNHLVTGTGTVNFGNQN